MLHVSHPKVQRIITQCERRVKKLTGNPTVTLSYVDNRKDLDFDQIFELCCKVVGVRKEKVLVKCRKVDLVSARHLTCYFCRMHTDLPLRIIAERLRLNDHSTVIHAVQRITDLIDAGDDWIVSCLGRINSEINRIKKVN